MLGFCRGCGDSFRCELWVFSSLGHRTANCSSTAGFRASPSSHPVLDEDFRVSAKLTHPIRASLSETFLLLYASIERVASTEERLRHLPFHGIIELVKTRRQRAHHDQRHCRGCDFLGRMCGASKTKSVVEMKVLRHGRSSSAATREVTRAGTWRASFLRPWRFWWVEREVCAQRAR